MSAPVTVQVTGLQELRVRFGAIPATVVERLQEAVKLQAALLASYIREEKLSGQVLKVQTGKLRSSVSSSVETSVSGATATIGVSAKSQGGNYAAYHEYGFSGTMTVREHLRTVTQAFGRAITPVEATVKAHTRKVEYGGRPFVHPSLAENRDTIVAALTDAVKRGMTS